MLLVSAGGEVEHDEGQHRQRRDYREPSDLCHEQQSSNLGGPALRATAGTARILTCRPARNAVGRSDRADECRAIDPENLPSPREIQSQQVHGTPAGGDLPLTSERLSVSIPLEG